MSHRIFATCFASLILCAAVCCTASASTGAEMKLEAVDFNLVQIHSSVAGTEFAVLRDDPWTNPDNTNDIDGDGKGGTPQDDARFIAAILWGDYDVRSDLNDDGVVDLIDVSFYVGDDKGGI